ncbi:MAG: GTPase HflX [Verrucomicrobiae bacterium]|nr:GTPase HflX [Verrucomicrobiae bacterium]
MDLKPTSRPPRRAFLLGVQWRRETREDAENLLEELAQLVETLGLEIVGRRLLRADRPQPRFLVGSGQAEECAVAARAATADVLVFDDVISPAQQRNWEKHGKLAVIDREEVILDIFARRARSREARLQVELARMEYALPRLTHAWRHLERQAGSGFGMTGAGETQLETDRRLVRRRIDQLRREIGEVRRHRATRRARRLRVPTPHAAIVGYTNAGKSSLFRRLTGEDVFVEDRLFATLDTTTRPIRLPDGRPLLVTDTVGFVRKLPHGLIESFKATLEEAVLSDFLVHVVDVANPACEQMRETTQDVLAELGADLRKVFTVLNKADLVPDLARRAALARRFPDALFVSAESGEGLDALRERLQDWLPAARKRVLLRIPHADYHLVAELHRTGKVLEERHDGDAVCVTAILPPRAFPRFAQYRLAKG